MAEMTRRYLRSLLNYEPKTGEWRWRYRKSGRAAIGQIAGSINSNGHRGIRIDGVMYQAHRLAFLYMNGTWPIDQVDHRNGVKDDNRWTNLREATNGQNSMNRGTRSDSRSGHKGVYLYGGDRFRAKIVVDGRQIYLGIFSTKEEAAAAYRVAADRFHGPFARSG